MHRRTELRALATRSHQVVVLAAITGIIVGAFVALFERVVHGGLDRVLELSPWVIAFFPGLGLLVGLAARRFIGQGASSATADEYLHAFHDRHHTLQWRPFVARIVAAVATVGSGAPMGLEGPSLYAGATIGSNLQRRLPRVFRDAERRTLLVAGAAAGVAAIFKAPATGAVFALEVPYQDDLARRMLLPALVASATGYFTFVGIDGTSRLIPVDGSSSLLFRDLLGALLVGVVAGIAARGFARMLRTAKRIAVGKHRLLTTVAAGVVLALTFGAGRLLTGESLLVSPGYNVVTWVVTAKHSAWLVLAIFVLRNLATSAAVAGGGAGGIFIPLSVAGALTGSVVATIVHHPDPTLFIVIGVAAFLGAGYRVPLAAVMFVAETTGRPSFIVPGLLAAVIAELMMGSSSVTKYQVGARPFDGPADADADAPTHS
ncbi:MAG: chloride channel protein [Actinomycetota bacterium]